MTVLMDAAAIYVGDVAAVAVYQGTRRVWPAWTGTPASVTADPDPLHTRLLVSVDATRTQMQVPVTPLLVVLDPAARDLAALKPTVGTAWTDRDGVSMVILSPPNASRLASLEGAPVELHWVSGGSWTFVTP
jgi:hypothetical protein